MPRRKARLKKVSAGLIEKLREIIRSGAPWAAHHCDEWERLHYLRTGRHYFGHPFGDLETTREAWSALREDFLAQHAKHKSCLPWAARVFDS